MVELKPRPVKIIYCEPEDDHIRCRLPEYNHVTRPDEIHVRTIRRNKEPWYPGARFIIRDNIVQLDFMDETSVKYERLREKTPRGASSEVIEDRTLGGRVLKQRKFHERHPQMRRGIAIPVTAPDAYTLCAITDVDGGPPRILACSPDPRIFEERYMTLEQARKRRKKVKVPKAPPPERTVKGVLKDMQAEAKAAHRKSLMELRERLAEMGLRPDLKKIDVEMPSLGKPPFVPPEYEKPLGPWPVVQPKVKKLSKHKKRAKKRKKGK